MVQFSLKLEHNRVDKWSDHYVQYSLLKKKIAQLRLARQAVGARPGRAYWRSDGVPLVRSSERVTATSDSPSVTGTASIARSSERTTLLSSPPGGTYDYGKTLLGRGWGEASGDKLSNAETDSFEDQLRKQIDEVERFLARKLTDLAQELAVLERSSTCEEFSPEILQQGLNDPRAFPSLLVTEQAIKMDKGGHIIISDAGRTLQNREKESLRRALLSLYRDLRLLGNFCIVNYTAVVKITKKYDKKVVGLRQVGGVMLEPMKPLTKKMLEYTHGQEFYNPKRLQKVIDACETKFARTFCGENLAEARGMMLPLKTDEKVDLLQFQLGYRLGIVAMLICWVLWDWSFEPTDYLTKCSIEDIEYNEQYLSFLMQPAFPVYRAFGGLLLLRWCWAFSALVWGRARINYIYLFDMDPRAISSSLVVFNNVALETALYLVTLLLYYKMLLNRLPHFMPTGCLPLMPCLYLLWTIWPSRKACEFWKVILRVLRAPLIKVDFFSTYVADVMTSSVKMTQDMAWAVCFFLSGDFLLELNEYRERGASWQRSYAYVNIVIPGLCFLPLWLRFLQSIRRYLDTEKRCPHLWNCLKYSLAFTVALFAVLTPRNSATNALKVSWLIAYVVSTLYSFWWDVVKDWGLGDPKYAFLRKQRLYSKTWFYYAVVLADLIMRFNWLYSLIPPGHLHFLHSSITSVFVTTMVTGCELVRRTMWGFFRVEKEHLDNTEGYRSTDYVPLHFTTERRDEERGKRRNVVLWEALIIMFAGLSMAIGAALAARGDQA